VVANYFFSSHNPVQKFHMPENLEIKAYLADIQAVPQACQRIGAELVRSFNQKDTYFQVAQGRLKLRESDWYPPALIAYNRLNSPTLRSSNFEILPLSSHVEGDRLKAMLTETVGQRGAVVKFRQVYEKDAALINVDTVEGLGNFVEIEVDAEKSGGHAQARATANEISTALGMSPADAVPWSYIDMLKMHEQAAMWRRQLDAQPKRGALIFVDGASGTGKTTLAHMLTQDKDLNISLVPRFSTRAPRLQESTETEYVFVKRDEFERLAQSGELLEFRDFDFGMSYGLAWPHLVEAVLQGKNALGIINLGSVRHVEQVLPEALTILMYASSETLRSRLVRRGVNNEEQIAERLTSAKLADSYRPYYDCVINNEEGGLEKAYDELREVISKHLQRS
jgi:predicted adenylyl cyclase CyaB